MNKTEDYGNGDSYDKHSARTHPGVAQALIDLPGVTEAYSIAGLYDLVAIVRVRDHEALADLVAGRVQGTPGIEATNTLIAFRGSAIGRVPSFYLRPWLARI